MEKQEYSSSDYSFIEQLNVYWAMFMYQSRWRQWGVDSERNRQYLLLAHPVVKDGSLHAGNKLLNVMVLR